VKKIALITIATGKYLSLIPDLYGTAPKYFLPGHEVKYLLFTDKVNEAKKISECEKATIFKIKHEKWPYITLKRYNTIFGVEDYLRDNFDYLYYIDADMNFFDIVGDEIMGDLVATKHPGFYNKPREEFIYEKRKESTAYITQDKGEHYFIGAFQGGKTDCYLKAVNAMKKNIECDLENKIIADWWDESHWNRYCSENKPDVVLSPSYCYIEQCRDEFERKIGAVIKNNDRMRYSFIRRSAKKAMMYLRNLKSKE